MRRGGFQFFLCAALVLHVAVLCLLYVHGKGKRPMTGQILSQSQARTEIVIDWATPAEVKLGDPALRSTSQQWEPVPRGASGLVSASIRRAAMVPASPANGAAGPSGAASKPAAEALDSQDAVSNTGQAALRGDGQDSASDESESPNLSLSQLGIGERSPFVLDPDTVWDPVAAAEDRLERNMAQANVERDAKHGAASHAVFAATVNQAAMGLAPPRSKARLSVIADEGGKVTGVWVVETNLDFAAWSAVASKALAMLADKRMTHGTGRPVRYVFEVESKVQVPSGRSPGLDVNVLGAKLKSSGHEDASRVDILKPTLKLEMVEVLDPSQSGGATVKLPVPIVGMTLLGIDGDLVDIGASGRQVVHTRLLVQQVL